MWKTNAVTVVTEGCLTIDYAESLSFFMFAEFAVHCHKCQQEIRGPQCSSCKHPALQCAICHLGVLGLLNSLCQINSKGCGTCSPKMYVLYI